ncbi:unnamed protein product [Candidula unifasciata]|uniref:Repulsive guidance molecule A n=1 Tax=Candidula unifasciata TaxID=100452 RepID=A0A8S3ZBI9_9EUPU|nr:unnamed protein product [Candidula unifasciata]
MKTRYNGHTDRWGLWQVRSEALRACRVPSSVAAWKGMGPCGCHKPPSFAVPSCCGYLVLFFCLVFISAEGSHQTGDCHVERCTNEYGKHQPALDTNTGHPQEAADSHTTCAALRNYGHCLNRTVGCHGNILYHSLRNYVRQQMEANNCSEQALEMLDRNSSSKMRQTVVPAACTYKGQNTYRHCGLFGDPHLRTFYDVFQTCRIKGAWPLVNNDYLTVQVTNDAIEGFPQATATSKLTVIVKGNPECTSADFQTYQAQTNSLPGTFDDGRVTVGAYDSLELIEVDPGKHIEIHIRYISTVVVVRQIGRYFTFSIKMPEDLVNKSSLSPNLQLCVRGCPQVELVNYQEYLATRQYSPSVQDVASLQVGLEPRLTITRSDAEEMCKETKSIDVYFDSCVFDILQTGDVNFTLAAMTSLMDVLKLHPSAARTLVNGSYLEKYEKQYVNNQGWVRQARTEYMSVFLLILTLLVHVICSR